MPTFTGVFFYSKIQNGGQKPEVILVLSLQLMSEWL